MFGFQFMIIYGLAMSGLITLARIPYEMRGMLTVKSRRLASFVFLFGVEIATAGGIGLVINHMWYS